MSDKNDSAFVYLWQDARQKPYMYYLGYHKGHPDDGYTHSSAVFESFTKDTIPDGVTRRIIATGSNDDMIELETKLLTNRKEKRWQQYYNMNLNGHPYMWEDPEYRAKMSATMSEQSKKLWEDPEYRATMSEQSKKLWEDPEYRATMSEQSKKLWEDPEYRAMQSEKAKEQWEDSDFRAMQSEKAKEQWEDSDFRAMQSEKAKEQWEDPDFRAKMSEKSKKLWEDPDFRAKMSVMQSEKSKKLWEDPDFRAMQSEKHTCTVCGFVGRKPHLARWHNDNCKHKK
jgi:hypothetical protein